MPTRTGTRRRATTRAPIRPGSPTSPARVEPPALVLPDELSTAFRPRTTATLPLTVWHELAHAFLLGREVVRTPAWLGEFVPQAASAAVARRVGLPLEEHLSRIDREPGIHRAGLSRAARAAGSDVVPEPAARARRGGAGGVRRGFSARHLPCICGKKTR